MLLCKVPNNPGRRREDSQPSDDERAARVALGVLSLLVAFALVIQYTSSELTLDGLLWQLIPWWMTVSFLLLHGVVRLRNALYPPKSNAIGCCATLIDDFLGVLIWGFYTGIVIWIAINPDVAAPDSLGVAAPPVLFFSNLWLLEKTKIRRSRMRLRRPPLTPPPEATP